MLSFVLAPRKTGPVLSTLNISRASGPDGIPPIVLKMCDMVSLLLSSLRQSTFPFPLTSVIVFPTPKHCHTSDPNSHLFITVTFVTSKVFEAVISNQFFPFLGRKGSLSGCQGEFRARRSTGDLLAVISNSSSAALDSHRNSPGLGGHRVWDSTMFVSILKRLLSFLFHSHISLALHS